MFKKIVKGLVVGGAGLILATSAVQAEQYEINIYGASAQYKFWTEAAPLFLISQGCDAGDIYHAVDEDQYSRDAGIAFCAGSDAIAGYEGEGLGGEGDSLIIRYTTNASYDGIRAVTGDTQENADAQYCSEYTHRYMPVADDETANYKQYSAADPDPGEGLGAFACYDVNVGASDVAAETFNQESEGYALGYIPNDDGSYTTMSSSIKYPDFLNDPDIDDKVEANQMVVVPFGFYANNGGYLDSNNELQTDSEKAVPFDNLSRLMAVSLFSGQVANWDDFDPSLDSQQVVLCLRHAGSGTHATLDAAVMRGDANLVTAQADPSTIIPVALGYLPQVWFNKGSSDELRCVGKRLGAVGYADADKCTTSCQAGTKYGKVKALTYQGVAPTATTIKNGQYLFWASQYLYVGEDDDDTKDYIDAMITWAADGANMASKKAGYWAAKDDMMWTKSDDYAYPIKTGDYVAE